MTKKQTQILEIATRIYLTQTAQIKFWKADDADLDRLMSMSVVLAGKLEAMVCGDEKEN